MNRGLSNELKEAFSDILPAPTPLSPIDQEIKDPNWVAGFATGEACFFIGVTKNPRIGAGSQIQLRLYIYQHSRDAQLMKSLIEYFKCGNLLKTRETVHFSITKFTDLTEKIIPFFILKNIQFCFVLFCFRGQIQGFCCLMSSS
jgi:hypothetical protein